MRVFINPGHAPNGSPDPGAVNTRLGLRESDIAFKIGVLAVGYLRKAGCDVKYLQSDNLCGEGDGPCVCTAANEWGADIFVSVHCNAFNGTARGIETLCFDKNSSGGLLAGMIQTQLVDAIQAIDKNCPDRGVKYRPGLAVLRCTDMPAVLVETAFIDNYEDAWLLYTYLDDFARAIARGVTDYELAVSGRTGGAKCQNC